MRGRFPDTEARLMTSPLPRLTMEGRKARHIRNVPRTLTSNTSSHSSGVMSVSGATGPAIPALLTRIDTSVPRRLFSSWSTDAGSATSTRASLRRPRELPRLPGGAPRGGLRPQRRRRRRKRARAMAAPRPVPPPVTSAVRPVRDVIGLRRRGWCRPGPVDPVELLAAVAPGADVARTGMSLEELNACRPAQDPAQLGG